MYKWEEIEDCFSYKRWINEESKRTQSRLVKIEEKLGINVEAQKQRQRQR